MNRFNFTSLPSWRARSVSLLLVGLLCLFLAATPIVSAQDSSGSIAQSFTSDNGNGKIEAGALVSTKNNDEHSVELATTRNANQLIGVADNHSLVLLSGNEQEISVVLSGATSVLVSDINGPIKASSKIAISPIAGVGMLANSNGQVVGTAQANFDIKNSRTQQITDDKGAIHTVHIGYVPLQVGIAYYHAPGSDFIPPFLQNIANSVAGKPVSLIRIALCSILILISFITIAMLIYSSVRTAITSLGRNPLAAKAIRRSLYQVGGVVIIVVAGTLAASYIILAV